LWEQKRLPRERSWTVSGPKDSGQVHQSAKTAPHGIIHLLLNLTCLTGFGLTAVAFVVSGTAGLTCRIAHLSLFYRRLLKAELREPHMAALLFSVSKVLETHKLWLGLFLQVFR
jgi:hypothetical protein